MKLSAKLIVLFPTFIFQLTAVLCFPNTIIIKITKPRIGEEIVYVCKGVSGIDNEKGNFLRIREWDIRKPNKWNRCQEISNSITEFVNQEQGTIVEISAMYGNRSLATGFRLIKNVTEASFERIIVGSNKVTIFYGSAEETTNQQPLDWGELKLGKYLPTDAQTYKGRCSILGNGSEIREILCQVYAISRLEHKELNKNTAILSASVLGTVEFGNLQERITQPGTRVFFRLENPEFSCTAWKRISVIHTFIPQPGSLNCEIGIRHNFICLIIILKRKSETFDEIREHIPATIREYDQLIFVSEDEGPKLKPKNGAKQSSWEDTIRGNSFWEVSQTFVVLPFTAGCKREIFDLKIQKEYRVRDGEIWSSVDLRYNLKDTIW